ncbi:competence protein CoiA [Sutcliffiella rhizosphaerae]|uniref:Competence protein CoiA n=1 Tax=Sutcliffiella rhizosphaerae TaxID=2880967 RepID=A0ABM8YSA3_9BACI|nr:competence protein CoiA family protein [Sutcliffiella rhizosphaerae]CAG9622838.1 Competence protein CoiA [Sutcliffiella rhizosphaerae]
MFVAKRADGSLISLHGISSNKEISIDGENFYCPVCNKKLLLKKGQVKRAHFAHQNKECYASSEPETLYHLEGKARLYEKLQGFDWKELEFVIPETKQRADVFVQNLDNNYAFEFQCSSLSSSEFKKRTELYEAANIKPVWIIGKDKLNPAVPKMKITSFQWQFLQSSSKENPPFILSFCPKNSIFYYLYPTFTLNSTTTYISLITSPSWIEYPEHSMKNRYLSWKSHFLHYKKKWRYHYCMYKPLAMLQRLCYEKINIPLSLIPARIGLPVTSFYMLHSPLIEWQAWIYFDSIYHLPINAQLHLSTILNAVRYRVINNQIRLRDLPLVKGAQYEDAVIEYLDNLEILGVLKRCNEHYYQKLLPETPLQTLKQAVYQDYLLLDTLIRLKKSR